MRKFFVKISLVAQIRSLYMRSIFKFPLGPLLWALNEPMGALKKTFKATLLHKLKGPVQPLEKASGDYPMVFDGWQMSNCLKSPTKLLANFRRICWRKLSLPVQKLPECFVWRLPRSILQKCREKQAIKRSIVVQNHHSYDTNKTMGIISFLHRKQKLSCGILCLTVEECRKPTKNWTKTILCPKSIECLQNQQHSN